MLDALIRWSLHNRLFVTIATMAMCAYGLTVLRAMPVDVFPDLTAPTVTVVTEAHGLAPQEVETLVTFPIESAVNGATGVRRVRSASGIGISVIWVEFNWDMDIYVARQIVSEKLQLVASQIPPDVARPVLAPIASVMGEILFLTLKSDRHSPLEVREAADWIIRKRLLAVPGVAQVIPIGGGVKQFQVLVDPQRLLAFDVTVEQVLEALKESNQNSSGGFFIRGAQEALIRGVGRIESREDIDRAVVAVRDGVPILIRHVATVEVGPAIKRGEGSSNAAPAVVLGVMKQPGANTLALTRVIDQHLEEIQKSLAEGMRIDRSVFRQADFIETAVHNVSIALRDGTILVTIILLLFLTNVRATLISLAALPVSLIVAILAMKAVGATINTMTLGGLTIAIGALVDDAIIDVENVVRRLRQNHALPAGDRQPVLEVIYRASREVRGSILFATAGIGNGIIGLIVGAHFPSDMIVVISALCLGAVSYGCSTLLDAYALRLLGAAREAAYFATAPFFGAALAWLLLRETVGIPEVVAAALITLGVVLLLRERHEHEHLHDSTVHDHMHVHDAHHQHDHAEAAEQPHSHPHAHDPILHSHPHVSDLHHRHRH